MASACALAMFSGKNLFIFVVQKRLRAFLNHFFTRGVWERTFPVAYGDIFPWPGEDVTQVTKRGALARQQP